MVARVRLPLRPRRHNVQAASRAASYDAPDGPARAGRLSPRALGSCPAGARTPVASPLRRRRAHRAGGLLRPTSPRASAVRHAARVTMPTAPRHLVATPLSCRTTSIASRLASSGVRYTVPATNRRSLSGRSLPRRSRPWAQYAGQSERLQSLVARDIVECSHPAGGWHASTGQRLPRASRCPAGAQARDFPIQLDQTLLRQVRRF